MRAPKTVRVYLWGTEIGRLTWNEDLHNAYFFFSQEYFSLPYDLCPILTPKDSRAAHFAITGDSDDIIYKGLPPFLADSLPDEWGSAILGKWITLKKLKDWEKTPLTMLSFIGKRGMGALEFWPDRRLASVDNRVDVAQLYEQSKTFEDAFSQRTDLDIDSRTLAYLTAASPFLGGRQKKAAVTLDDKGVFYSDQTFSNSGHRNLIIKFGDPKLCPGEIEYTYYLMAKEADITMMPSGILDIGKVRCFCTERFDRLGGEKVMTQTLASINPSVTSYEGLFETMRRLLLPEACLKEMFRRMVFNVLSNNTNDHIKNFSFIMDRKGQRTLSPAYDLNFTFNEDGSGPKKEHCLSVKGKFSCISKSDILAVARDFGVRNPISEIERVSDAIAKFDDLSKKAGVSEDFSSLITKTLSDLSFGTT